MPFLCLPVSATLYAILKDNHNVDAKLVTGDLTYKGQYIFRQDFSIKTAQSDVFQKWAGHAWVEFGGMICDLSIFRTLYSDEFTKPCRSELVQIFGQGRGCLIASQSIMQVAYGLSYNAIDYLDDDMATGIIKGFEPLLAHGNENR